MRQRSEITVLPTSKRYLSCTKHNQNASYIITHALHFEAYSLKGCILYNHVKLQGIIIDNTSSLNGCYCFVQLILQFSHAGNISRKSFTLYVVQSFFPRSLTIAKLMLFSTQSLILLYPILFKS